MYVLEKFYWLKWAYEHRTDGNYIYTSSDHSTAEISCLI